MPGIAKLLVLLAVITFLLAVVGAWTGTMMGIGAEALSRACTNLRPHRHRHRHGVQGRGGGRARTSGHATAYVSRRTDRSRS